MKSFTVLQGVAAPMDRANVDTDLIIPKQFLKSVKRSGFGPNLFDELRYTDEGQPGQDCSTRTLKADFPLNQARYQGASILLARENFGCGSSREHAPLALEDYGFRCIIAPSYADIFYNNCFNNGLLPIVLTESEIDILFTLAEGKEQIEIDLENQTIFSCDSEIAHFEIDPFRKKCILEGLDEIGLSLTHSEQIKEFERKRVTDSPWIYINEKQNG